MVNKYNDLPITLLASPPRALLSFKGDRHEDHRGIIALGRSDSADRGSVFARRFFTTSSPAGPLRRADRRCTPFLYPNNLQSTAWHRTLLRNIVISPQLPGLFSTAYLRRPAGRCTRVCPSLHVDPDTWRLRERRLPAEVRT